MSGNKPTRDDDDKCSTATKKSAKTFGPGARRDRYATRAPEDDDIYNMPSASQVCVAPTETSRGVNLLRSSLIDNDDNAMALVMESRKLAEEARKGKRSSTMYEYTKLLFRVYRILVLRPSAPHQ